MLDNLKDIVFGFYLAAIGLSALFAAASAIAGIVCLSANYLPGGDTCRFIPAAYDEWEFVE